MPRGGPRDTRRILIAAGRMHALAIRFSDVKPAAVKFSTMIERGSRFFRPDTASRRDREARQPGRKRFSVSGGSLADLRCVTQAACDDLNDRDTIVP